MTFASSIPIEKTKFFELKLYFKLLLIITLNVVTEAAIKVYGKYRPPLSKSRWNSTLFRSAFLFTLFPPKALRMRYSKSVGSKILNSVILFVLAESFF